jgi:hypothetical protein
MYENKGRQSKAIYFVRTKVHRTMNNSNNSNTVKQPTLEAKELTGRVRVIYPHVGEGRP